MGKKKTRKDQQQLGKKEKDDNPKSGDGKAQETSNQSPTPQEDREDCVQKVGEEIGSLQGEISSTESPKNASENEPKKPPPSDYVENVSSEEPVAGGSKDENAESKEKEFDPPTMLDTQQYAKHVENQMEEVPRELAKTDEEQEDSVAVEPEADPADAKTEDQTSPQEDLVAVEPGTDPADDKTDDQTSPQEDSVAVEPEADPADNTTEDQNAPQEDSAAVEPDAGLANSTTDDQNLSQEDSVDVEPEADPANDKTDDLNSPQEDSVTVATEAEPGQDKTEDHNSPQVDSPVTADCTSDPAITSIEEKGPQTELQRRISGLRNPDDSSEDGGNESPKQDAVPESSKVTGEVEAGDQRISAEDISVKVGKEAKTIKAAESSESGVQQVETAAAEPIELKGNGAEGSAATKVEDPEVGDAAAKEDRPLQSPEVGDAAAKEDRPLQSQAHSYVQQFGYQGFNELKTYERARRRRFTRQLRQNEVYWRALVELADRSRLNSQRTLGFLKAKAAADHSYAQHLMLLPSAVYREETRATKTDDPEGPKRIAAGSQVLSELFELQSRAGQAHGEFSSWTQEELVTRLLTPMTLKFGSETQAIYAEGNACVQTHLQKEQQVQRIYDVYCTVAGKLLNVDVEGTSDAQPKSEKELVVDLWLADMHYRSAILQQQKNWEKGGKTLAKLFSKMKELERDRRENLRHCLKKFAERQVEMWAQLNPLSAPLQSTLDKIVTDKEGLDKEISSAIRACAAEIENQESNVKEFTPPSVDETDSESMPTLDSPMLSPLVLRCGILKRKAQGLMAKWKPFLAVATADHFLHLFDFGKSGGSLSPEADGQQAYTLLMSALPDLEQIMPVTSIRLRFCEIEYRPQSGDAAFEVTETTPNTGMVKMIKANAIRKFLFKATGQEDMVEWVVKMKGQS